MSDVLDFSDCPHVKSLGEGSYATVYLWEEGSGRQFALKFVNEGDDKLFHREIDTLMKARHVTCLSFYGVIKNRAVLPEDVKKGLNPKTKEGTGPIIVTEYMPKGTVMNAQMSKDGTLPGWDATARTKSVMGIAVGMYFLHCRDILHRDLKLDNVLLDENLEIKIGDFGLSRTLDVDMTRAVSNVLIEAPEVKTGRYDGKVDVYSYAVAVWMHWVTYTTPVLLVDAKGEIRPLEVKDGQMNIEPGDRLARVDGIPQIYWDLITECWAEKPEDRPTFRTIVERFEKNLDAYCFPGADKDEVKEYFERVTEDLLPRPVDIPTERLREFLASKDPNASPFGNRP